MIDPDSTEEEKAVAQQAMVEANQAAQEIRAEYGYSANTTEADDGGYYLRLPSGVETESGIDYV